MIKKITQSVFGLCTVILILFVITACQHQNRDFWDRSSMEIAKPIDQQTAAIVQVYAARAARWRGHFSVHCWIAYKLPNDQSYKVAQVIGWRLRRGSSAIVWGYDVPDRRWFGADAELLLNLEGPQAMTAIPKIEQAIAAYPYADRYTAWPGPNSNTFISHIIRSVPELTVELPSNAIGKEWLPNGPFSMSESGSGIQVSLWGLAGFVIGWAEGLELSILGLTFGVDVRNPALKLPLIGRLGFRDNPL